MGMEFVIYDEPEGFNSSEQWSVVTLTQTDSSFLKKLTKTDEDIFPGKHFQQKK